MSLAWMNTRDVWFTLLVYAQRMINNPTTTPLPGIRNFMVMFESFNIEIHDKTETGKVLKERLKDMGCVSATGGRVRLPNAAYQKVEDWKRAEHLEKSKKNKAKRKSSNGDDGHGNGKKGNRSRRRPSKFK